MGAARANALHQKASRPRACMHGAVVAATTARLASVGSCLCPPLLLLCAAAVRCCGALLLLSCALPPPTHPVATGSRMSIAVRAFGCARLRQPQSLRGSQRLGGGNCWCGEVLLQCPADTHTYAPRGRSVTATYICLCIAARALYHTDPGILTHMRGNGGLAAAAAAWGCHTPTDTHMDAPGHFACCRRCARSVAPA